MGSCQGALSPLAPALGILPDAGRTGWNPVKARSRPWRQLLESCPTLAAQVGILSRRALALGASSWYPARRWPHRLESCQGALSPLAPALGILPDAGRTGWDPVKARSRPWRQLLVSCPTLAAQVRILSRRALALGASSWYPASVCPTLAAQVGILSRRALALGASSWNPARRWPHRLESCQGVVSPLAPALGILPDAGRTGWNPVKTRSRTWHQILRLCPTLSAQVGRSWPHRLESFPGALSPLAPDLEILPDAGRTGWNPFKARSRPWCQLLVSCVGLPDAGRTSWNPVKARSRPWRQPLESCPTLAAQVGILSRRVSPLTPGLEILPDAERASWKKLAAQVGILSRRALALGTRSWKPARRWPHRLESCQGALSPLAP